MGGVLFVVMPFCGVERPQIGVSTLKAQLRKEGIPSDIAYFNISFNEFVGYDDYCWITNSYDYTVFAGEWAFARSLFSEREINSRSYIDDVLVKQGQFTAEMIQRVQRIAAQVPAFLDFCMSSVDWDRYSVIGFTSTFEQNVASLSLAKRIKERFPDKLIAMGGANCGGPMGLQLHQSFPFLDFVFTGEADLGFPELLKTIARGDTSRDHIKGYVYRSEAAVPEAGGPRKSLPIHPSAGVAGAAIAANGSSVDTGAPPLIHDLDTLPYPDYDDFFSQFRSSSLSRRVAPLLQIETARGCWWGAKQHCTFCGLNRDEMTFRAKSPERALDEILHLIARYGVKFISAVDNIISMHYFKTLLPELKRRKLGASFFYETKANLKKEHVELLRDAGVTEIQPGIESFSDHTLKLMRKGVSPLQNVQLLKWCQEAGMEPKWNLLVGFPGENRKDYDEVLQFIQGLSHLPPAEGWGPLRLDRFSPYFDFPDRFGVRIKGALDPYRYIYPFDDQVLYNLAYFFEYDFDGKEKVMGWFEPVRRELEQWKERHRQSRLEVVRRSADGIIVRDSRVNRTSPEYRFGKRETEILDFCDGIKTFKDILQHVAKVSNGSSPSEEWIRDFLEYLISHRLMLRMGEHYLCLIMPQPAADVRYQRSASVA